MIIICWMRASRRKARRRQRQRIMWQQHQRQHQRQQQSSIVTDMYWLEAVFMYIFLGELLNGERKMEDPRCLNHAPSTTANCLVTNDNSNTNKPQTEISKESKYVCYVVYRISLSPSRQSVVSDSVNNKTYTREGFQIYGQVHTRLFVSMWKLLVRCGAPFISAHRSLLSLHVVDTTCNE